MKHFIKLDNQGDISPFCLAHVDGAGDSKYILIMRLNKLANFALFKDWEQYVHVLHSTNKIEENWKVM